LGRLVGLGYTFAKATFYPGTRCRRVEVPAVEALFRRTVRIFLWNFIPLRCMMITLIK
jgi:hypothetical protein